MSLSLPSPQHPDRKPSRGRDRERQATLRGWTVKDEMPVYRLIDKNDLLVDPSYQRPETESKVAQIRRCWSWAACGAIIVAERGSDLFVTDGNHRVVGARGRDDIHMLPCLVFRSSGPEAEAQVFLDANTNRKPITSLDRFRARCAAGDKPALRIKDLLDQHGYEPSDQTAAGTRVVKCLTTIYKAFTLNSRVFEDIWPLVVEVAGGGPIKDRVFDSLFYIENALRESGSEVSLLHKPWRPRVLSLGTPGILKACGEADAFYVAGGAKVWARGVVRYLNKGVRNKFPLFQDDVQ